VVSIQLNKKKCLNQAELSFQDDLCATKVFHFLHMVGVVGYDDIAPAQLIILRLLATAFD